MMLQNGYKLELQYEMREKGIAVFLPPLFVFYVFCCERLMLFDDVCQWPTVFTISHILHKWSCGHLVVIKAQLNTKSLCNLYLMDEIYIQ